MSEAPPVGTHRLFLRLYAAIAGAVVIALAGAVVLLGLVVGTMRAGARSDVTELVHEAFVDRGDEAAMDQLRRDYGVRVELEVPGTRPPERVGPPPVRVSLGDGRAVWVWPRPPVLVAPVVGAAAAAVVLLALALAVAWWLRPLQRGLDELTDAAARFGKQDLSARARVDPGGPTAELAGAFNTMADRIAAMVRGQEELLVGVSHELRTPLMRMRFALELLPEVPPDRLAELLHDVEELDRTVGEVLAWGRVQHGVVPRRDVVDLDALVHEVAGEAGRQRPGVTVEVDVAPGTTAEGDAALLARALRNLASNAVRYGRSRVRLGARADDGGFALWAEDDGPGIPAGDRQAVLQPFVRLDPSRADGGVGLGLALVDRVAVAHGGQVRIEEGALGGARVMVVGRRPER